MVNPVAEGDPLPFAEDEIVLKLLLRHCLLVVLVFARFYGRLRYLTYSEELTRRIGFVTRVTP